MTSAHVVAASGQLKIRRIEPRHRAKVLLPATRKLAGEVDVVDLALVELDDDIGDIPVVGFVRVDRDTANAQLLRGCWAVGFPQFRTLASAPDGPIRETAQVNGVIPTAEGLYSGLLTFRVTSAPRPLPPEKEALGQSPWSGMSGAAVLVNDRIIGVITEHQPRAGESMLTVTPIDALETLNPAESEAWWHALGTDLDSLPHATVSLGNQLSSGPADPRGDSGVRYLWPTRPAQLPPDIPGFVGRVPELTRLRDLVRNRNQAAGAALAVVALSGAAGIGKTALAVHAAHELKSHFVDGQFHIDLQGYDARQRLQPSQVLDRFLRALGVRNELIPSSLEERASLYRSLLADKRVIVILDNASSPQQVRLLLPGTANGLVLITSRDRLTGLVATHNAQILGLDILHETAAVEMLARTAGPERTDCVGESAIAVVNLCGRLPLAMRIAGARLAARPDITIEHYVEQLASTRDRLSELYADDVSVRVSFSLSYENLDQAESQLFRRLGHVAGPSFSVLAAAVLANVTIDDAARDVDTLVDRHLVEPAGSQRRYRFHDLIRLYARDRLAGDEDDASANAALVRLLDWYLSAAMAADRFLAPARRMQPAPAVDMAYLPTFLSSSDALSWFDSELANLIGALSYAVDNGHPSYAWLIPVALWTFFDIRKHWTEWQQAGRVGLAAARQAQNRVAEARMLNYLGGVYLDLHEFDRAIEHFEESISAWCTIQDPHGKGASLNNLGEAYIGIKQYSVAKHHLERALALWNATDYRHGRAWTLTNLGAVGIGLNDLDYAVDMLRNALDAWLEIGDKHGQASALANLGDACMRSEAYEQAEIYLQQAIQIRRDIGDRYGEGGALHKLGILRSRTGGLSAAEPFLLEAEQLFDGLGAPEVWEVRETLRKARGGEAVG